MLTADGLFMEACGANRPLELAWTGWPEASGSQQLFGRPAVLVGRNPDADLHLVDDAIGRRHAYLQVVQGRLFALDLDSRTGCRWAGVPRQSGWVDPSRPVQIGPTTITVLAPWGEGDDEPGPGPTSRRFESRWPLPEAHLEICRADGRTTRLQLERVLTTMGRSPRCSIRLSGSAASHFACGLVRTPRGVWLVDLLASRGVTVNGIASRCLRLEDGDVLGLANQSIRLIYGVRSRNRAPLPATAASTAPGSALAAAVPPALLQVAPATCPDVASTGNHLASPEAGCATDSLPELILRQIQAEPVRSAGPASTYPDPTLMMLVRLLGAIYKDQLETIRAEAEQIRRLDHEIHALKAQAPPPQPASHVARPENLPDLPPDAVAADRPTPQLVKSLVSERLDTWERERQGRWRKVMGLLVGSD